MPTLAPIRTGWLVHGLTIGALAVVFAFYDLVYVPSRTADLVERKFRRLADLGEQIQDALSGLHTSLTNAAAPLTACGGEGPASLLPHAVQSFANNIAQIEPPLTLVTSPSRRWGAAFTCREVKLEPTRMQCWLDLSYAASSNDSSFVVRADLADLLRPLLSRYREGDILLARTNGEVLFQKSQVQSRARNPESRSDLVIRRLTFQDGGKHTNLVTDASSLSDILIRGERYQIFSQPLPLAFGASAAARDEWLVCWLIRAQDFSREAWQVSPTLAVLFLFLAGAVLLSWPLFNVIFSPPAADTRRLQVVALLVSSFFICSSLTGILLYADAYLSAKNDLDRQGVRLAREVRQQLTNELARVSRLLTDLDHELGRQATQAATGHANTWESIRRRPNILRELPAAMSYPFFSDVCWIGRDGVQSVKWVPRDNAPELVPVADRPYFRTIRDQRAWPCRAFSGASSTAAPAADQFYLESIFSRVRNENTAVFSQPFSPAVEWPKLSASGGASIERPLVSTVIFQPLSLFRSILPTGYSFAIVEDTGRVLFHADSQRNLRENLLTETGRNRRLQSALLTRTADSFGCRYANQPHHLAVEPIPDLPWTVVAFRDQRVAAAAHRNSVLAAIVLYGLYSLVAGLFLLFGSLWRRQILRRTNRFQSGFCWLWPGGDSDRCFVHLLMAGGAALLVFVLILFCNHAPWLILLGLLAPGLFGVIRLMIAPNESPSSPDRPTGRPVTRRAHVGSLALGLILLAMLPSFACYKTTFLKETEALVKAVQLQLTQDLRRRLASVQTSPNPAAATAHAGTDTPWNVFRRAPAWGQYYEVFYDLSVLSPEPADAPLGSAPSLWERRFVDLYRACRPSLEETGLPTRGLLAAAADDESWRSRWSRDRLILTVRDGAVPSRPSMQVQAEFPAAGWLNRVWPAPFWELDWRLAWYGGLLLVLAVPFGLAWFIGHRFLLLDLPRSPPAQPDDDDTIFWLSCRPSERLTLYQVARNGFVHPSSRDDLRRALAKNRVQFVPELSLEPRFRDYVLSHYRTGAPAQARPQAEPPSPLLWLSVRGAIGVAITAIALFLFATQEEVWQLAVAFTGAFATLAQQLPKLSWIFTSRQPPE